MNLPNKVDDLFQNVGYALTCPNVNPDTVCESDIRTLCDFLIRLDGLKDKPGTEKLPPASEAYFTVPDVIRNIRKRLNLLTEVENSGREYIPLAKFLKQTLVPLFNHIIGRSRVWLADNNMDGNRPLSYAERTLSPSDFGFHNAIRLTDGSLVFLDFEYFGWDDPAKLIIDFVLHPAMTLRHSLKRQFAESMTSHFEHSGLLKSRIGILYPLFGIKWSLILLNEFVPEEAARREFAGSFEKTRKETVLKEQLLKATRMMHTIRETYDKGNPLGC